MILDEFWGIKKSIKHKKLEEKKAHPENEKWKRRYNHIKEWNANLLGEFYSKLYAEERLGEEVQDPHNSETKMNTGRESCNDDVQDEIPEITQDEVQTAITGKSK